jgi:hypothetical protein
VTDLSNPTCLCTAEERAVRTCSVPCPPHWIPDEPTPRSTPDTELTGGDRHPDDYSPADYPIGTYATIKVENGASRAWPVVERVGGGWQSGAHHYPDDTVSAVRVLTAQDVLRRGGETGDHGPEKCRHPEHGKLPSGAAVGWTSTGWELCSTTTLRSVPNTPGTPRRTIRVPDALWDAAQTKAEERGDNLSDVIRRALERYVKR